MQIGVDRVDVFGIFPRMGHNFDPMRPEAVAPRLRAVREARCSKTKKDISLELGLAENTISKYETARQRPSLEHFRMLADYYRVPIEYLICGEHDRIPLELAKKMGLV